MTPLQYVLPANTMLFSAWPQPAARPAIAGCALPPIQRVAPIGPACLVSRRPGPRIAIPECPAPAESAAELREWATKNYRWLSLSRWSRGIVALHTEVRPRRTTPAVEDMTVQQLADSQSAELPTISREMFDELGVEALSLDAPASGQDIDLAEGSIGEAIGAEAIGFLLAELQAGEVASNISQSDIFADYREDALTNYPRDQFPELSDDQYEAEIALVIEGYLAEDLSQMRSHMARRYGTPFTFVHPDIRDRIEWEQYIAQGTDVTAREGFRLAPDRVTYFCWPPVRGKEFIERRDSFVRRFLDGIGREVMPSPAEFAERRDVLRALAGQWRWRFEADQIDDAHTQLASERAWLIEREGAMSWDEIDTEPIPTYTTFVETAWRAVKPTKWISREEYTALRAQARAEGLAAWRQAISDAEAYTVHHCRNPRQHGGRDEMWHTVPRDPAETAIGWLDDEFEFDEGERLAPHTPSQPPVLKTYPITVVQHARLMADAQRAIERFAVCAFSLGKKTYVFHS